MEPSEVFQTMDGCEAAASVAYRTSEVIAIYPITPSSAMGEWADAWAAEGRTNLWGTVPAVVEMQSEGGAAGVLHGALQTGSLATSFTASQGLLLMIPNMYKIAGELTPFVLHVAARSLASHALSIFGDQSDVMAARATGFALLCAASVQEAADFAAIALAATLESRIPFLHFFDGFRTSHEIAKIRPLSDALLRAMLEADLITAHRMRALSPDHPVMRGTAQNPDIFFQSREALNSFYANCPGITQKTMDRFAALSGRTYRLFDYHGSAEAEQVIVLMGSGAETVQETVDFLNARGAKTGVLKVRLYRPFDVRRFLEALPGSVKALAVLDRTKEAGSAGEPLYLDCVSALSEGLSGEWGKIKAMPKIVGGRYGLSSKEFTPGMARAVFENLGAPKPKSHFTVGISDDVTFSSLSWDPAFSVNGKHVFEAVFYGLGSDGTVGANKNSIKIIGENTGHFAQGYFVYDSRKSGAVTISHLRFGPEPIRAPYLVQSPAFVACHQPIFLERYDMLSRAREGGVFLLNTPHKPEDAWTFLPARAQEDIAVKKLKFYVIDAYKVAQDCGMGSKINTVMQVCFFAISGVLPKEQAIREIKKSIEKTYAKKGEEVVRMNLAAVDRTLANLFAVRVPDGAFNQKIIPPPASVNAPAFVQDVLGAIIEGRGDEIPVSMFPCDGTYPTSTAKWEKRNLAIEIPVWEPHLCVECGKCAFVCPHSAIRIKAYESDYLDGAPAAFKARDAREADWKGLKYTIQTAPEDCTGCGICVEICPAQEKKTASAEGVFQKPLKALHMEPQPPLRETERDNWEFFLSIPELDRSRIKVSSLRQQQAQAPLFEFPSACSGCGETPYIKLVTQLFGDRALIANATGCSSIFGGNLPTTPWTKNEEGRGPAWANSLFEDNAEFGFGFRVSIDKQREFACGLLRALAPDLGPDFAAALIAAPQKTEADIFDQRARVEILKKKLVEMSERNPAARSLLDVADALVKKSVWIVGGDGWAYDIGFGGLDHVLAGKRNVNILVLDTEVYSNTGGQASKATPRGAVAKFAAAGKDASKKDLGLMAMTYGHVYVASVALGARDEHTLKAFLEAEAYDGPSLIIAYSHCIAHGINMRTALQDHKAAVDSGDWILYRFHPERVKRGENPLVIDSREPNISLDKFLQMENRFRMLSKADPEQAARLFKELERDIKARWTLYQYLAARKSETFPGSDPAPPSQGPEGHPVSA